MRKWFKIQKAECSMAWNRGRMEGIRKFVSEGRVSIEDDRVFRQFMDAFIKYMKAYSYLVSVGVYEVPDKVVAGLKELEAIATK